MRFRFFQRLISVFNVTGSALEHAQEKMTPIANQLSDPQRLLNVKIIYHVMTFFYFNHEWHSKITKLPQIMDFLGNQTSV